jgi:antitoxin component of MazEF toxin-antitoxin module
MGEMAKKNTLKKTQTHKLTVSGGKSYVVVLPVQFVRQLGWRERQKLDITLDGKQIVIKDWKG